ncbi:MAG: hypothetical protein M1294_11840 [Firmicutes bacterium]|jgi:hypothetical protein|uniref:Uncharacterized protein n=1 Tax=Sulfobacillus benefaciens TaxID=453960 RepID=A0A2T2X1J8_9FIRM|nr:hypothetical protein [Bacillota bacterium]MCL5013895.1 hypothetical protein [Bacillota bacterium]PSR28359.1 MAG: hypothetical protein C7B43_10290 [Sulfobacillus benefaciens]
MMALHAEKPPISAGLASLDIDLIFWHPKVKDIKALQYFLETNSLDERAQSVVWLKKFTMRLSMWKGQYLHEMSLADWNTAMQALDHFLRQMNEYYHPRRIEYDTRAFTVGLVKKVRHRTRPLSILTSESIDRRQPAWWNLKI